MADEDCYPYVASVERCRAKKSDNLRTLQCSTLIDEKDTLYKMGPAYSLNNETDIMWEIYHYGPVQGEIDIIQLMMHHDGLMSSKSRPSVMQFFSLVLNSNYVGSPRFLYLSRRHLSQIIVR